MILFNNSVYDKTVSNSSNYIQLRSEEKAIESVSSRSIDSPAATLSISNDGIRRLNSERDGVVRKKEDESAEAKNVLARIQKYMSRSLQLEHEAAEENLTMADKQTIENEINKITLVVNNLSDSSNSEMTKLMENSIQLYGDVVTHSRENILTNAQDALVAQAQISNMDALALLA